MGEVSEAHENIRLVVEEVSSQSEMQSSVKPVSGAVIGRLVLHASARIEKKMSRPVSFHEMSSAALVVVGYSR